MSVWRNFLAAILPWIFKAGDAAAEAAVAGKTGAEVGQAAEAVGEQAAADPNVQKAATDAAQKTADSVVKAVKGK
jgi:hypothetical protein